jgi:hypothetical protein
MIAIAVRHGSRNNARPGLLNTPELREMCNQAMPFVFGL